MIFLFYFFAVIQVFFAYKSFRGGIEYLEFFKAERGRPIPDFTPFAAVIVPCRGLDKELEENLRAIIDQNYPHYEIVFVVDAEDDPAAAVIEKFLSVNEPIKSSASSRLGGKRLVVAGRASESGQKVHNLRRAVAQTSAEAEVFVFVDSDARPRRDWLRHLVAPLADEKTGCATGYRWFVQKNGGLATHLRSAWNASIASALGRKEKRNFCWGGSTAIRRETFERLNIREKWKGTVSDDFALTNALKEASMPVRFVPNCLTATVEDCTFRELFEFTTRQMKITRVYSPGHFKVSLIGAVLFIFTFWPGIVLLFFLAGVHFWLTLFILVIIFAFGIGKAWLRLKAVGLVLEDYRERLHRQFFWQITLWTVAPVIYLYNDLTALVSRRINWRGIEYKLESPHKTLIEGNDGQ